ncbi:biotin-dependent carboxyltransferase family protein [Marinicella sp. S1101]|uniref:5-oxoprolinase subunit C family protein n=1 Tax=Marinicella marina TaxID=2996016 RepID=UPI0022608C50|nr:biotin-dependent carboxyltransferase family protein [Marinicella marina]MCX7554943.1 biotin-dependent carboxyltransferase family protein [Marinicella marina]MDJ1141553.1 biotin-dependent carboxyltransferase family protein [Marinicella marina]
MAIEIIQAGGLTTVQDGGRWHAAHLGFPVSGCMDQAAAQLANHMVGNEPGCAVLEMSWSGLEFTAQQACSMALAGAEFICQLDGQEVSTDSVIQLRANSHFKMQRLLSGVRAYAAFAGGIDVPVLMGSKSTLLSASVGGFNGRPLRAGDVVELSQPHLVTNKGKPNWKKYHPPSFHVVRAMPGPEVHLFSQNTIKQAFSQSYELTAAADRQGFRLKSKPLDVTNIQVTASSGLVPGSLQVTPDGQAILAMRDAQTTGGYPRILVVHQQQLSLLAQVRPGEKIHFFVETRF